MVQNKKLYRSRSDRMIGGICGGLGVYLGIDSTVLRLIFVLIAAISGGVPALIAYVIMLFIVPEEPLGGPAGTPPPPPADPEI